MKIESMLDEITSLSEQSSDKLAQIRRLFKQLNVKLRESLKNAPSDIIGASEPVTTADNEVYSSYVKLCFTTSQGLHIRESCTENYLDEETVYDFDTIDDFSLEKLATANAHDRLLINIFKSLESKLENYTLIQNSLERSLDSILNDIENDFEDSVRKTEYEDIIADFRKARLQVHTHPEESLTNSSSLLESLFKRYLLANEIDISGDQSIRPLLKKALKELNLHGDRLTEEDLQSIMRNLAFSVGTLRTHQGNAHGRSPDHLPIDPLEARLAVSAAGIVATYFLSKVLASQNPSQNARRETQVSQD